MVPKFLGREPGLYAGVEGLGFPSCLERPHLGKGAGGCGPSPGAAEFPGTFSGMRQKHESGCQARRKHPS